MKLNKAEAAEVLGINTRTLYAGKDTKIRTAKIIGAWLFKYGVTVEHLRLYARFYGFGHIQKKEMLEAMGTTGYRVLLPRTIKVRPKVKNPTRTDPEEQARLALIKTIGALAIVLGATVKDKEKIKEFIAFKDMVDEALSYPVNNEDVKKIQTLAKKVHLQAPAAA